MKKILFLVLVLQNLLFSYTYAPSRDLLIYMNSNGSIGYYDKTLVGTIWYVQTDSDNNHYFSGLLRGGCGEYDATTVRCYLENYRVIPNYQCPSGQEVVNGACVVPPTCPNGQIWNSDTDTCACPPPPAQYRLLFETLETPESCTLINALLSLEDGDTNTISSVYWDSCNAQCLGELQPCPCGQSIKNGQCMNVEPPAGSCPSGNITFQTYENLIEPNCVKFWFCDGYVTAFFSSNVGCCLGNDGTSDSNSTNPDSNSTNPDSNSSDPSDPSDPGDSGEDGEEDGGETGGGDSNTSTPAPGGGDSNTSTPGDSNTTSAGQYEDSDADKEGKGVIDGALSNAGVTFDKIQSDFIRLMNAIENGVAPISVSSGSAPQFCATVFGKQICINLCDTFGYFYTIFYYMFLILFTVMALRIYYTAFKMR